MMTNLLSALAETAGEVTATDSTQVATSGGFIEMIVMLVVMVAIMYFLMIRPQKKKEKAVKNMLAALKPGDRICTIGGIYGTITAIKDDVVTISVGPDKVRLVFIRGAIASVEDSPVENTIEDQAN